jgi:CubicO group peptidase (beta-lactamase class C family)
VEVASGQSYDEFLRDRVFQPLGMNSTFFLHDDAAISADRLATLYRTGNNGIEKFTSFLKFPQKYYCGAGGLVSCAEDYFRFAQMLLNGGDLEGKRLLSPRSVALMSSNHVGEMFGGQLGRPSGMGFGFTVEVVVDSARSGMFLSEGSYGWDGAFGTRFWVNPRDNLVTVFMVQSPAGPVVGGINRDFETAAMQALVD